VRICDDPEAMVDGVSVGGISQPQLGDGLLRLDDPPDARYGFEFVIQRGSDSWLLRFSRRWKQQMGLR